MSAETYPIDTNAVLSQIELLKSNLAVRTYPHYPAFEDRLVLEQETVQEKDGQLVLPDGPWTVDNYPEHPSPEHAPNAVVRQALAAQGLRLDSIGRPLHPWLGHMALDSAIGIVTGKGAYYNWGPNYTGDPVVIQNEHVLLVLRKDTSLWSLPGGHLDPGEDGFMAASREATEESGVHIPPETVPVMTYQGPVVDLRVSANAWPETVSVLYHLPDAPELQKLTPQKSEVKKAEWIPLDTVRNEQVMFGSHRFLLDEALKHYKSPS